VDRRDHPLTMPLHLDRLDDAALEAASSRGLVRRAHRDLESGAAKVLRLAPEEAQVELPDATVTLHAGGLAAARCTCPAGDICRHILAAVILLRRQAADASAGEPGQDKQVPDLSAPVADPVAEILAYTQAQLEKALGRALVKRAAGALPDPAAVTITVAAPACVVRIAGGPEVHYIASRGIPGMQVQGAGLYEETGALAADGSRSADLRLLAAQALLAVRRAHQVSAPAHARRRRATAASAVAIPDELLARAGALVVDWARAGLASTPQPLEDRLFDVAIEARAAGLFRLGAGLRRLAEDVCRRRERDADLEPAASLRAAARAFALIEALRRAPADAVLRGAARDTFEPLGGIRLIGCGYEIWKTATDARGVTGHFYAPEARAWFSASLARSAGQDPRFVPEQAVQRDSVWGATLERLCMSEVILQDAAASPGGRLSLSLDTRASLRPVTLRRDEISAWEGSFTQWSALDGFIRGRFAPALRAVRRSTEVALLLPARTGRPAFDEIAQELVLPLLDREGSRLDVRVANQPHLEQRLSALQEILAGKSPEAFFVTLAVAGEQLRISPYALLLDSDSTPWSLDARRAPQEGSDVRALTDWLTREIDQVTADLSRPAAGAPSTSIRLLTAALDVLLGLCELGGQMHDPGLLGQLSTLARRLEEAGLRPAALLLAAVSSADERGRPASLLVAAHALDGMLELLRLPIA
jgi:hypothetical protein